MYLYVREMISMWKNVLLAYLCSYFYSVFSINKFSVNEIYHTLDSKIIFNSTLITISNSLYLSHSLFLFNISSLLFPSFSHNLSILSSTSFAIRTTSLYLPHLFDFTTYIHWRRKMNVQMSQSATLEEKSLLLHEVLS